MVYICKIKKYSSVSCCSFFMSYAVSFPCHALLISHMGHILLMLFKTQRATDQTEHDKCTCCIPSLCPAASQTLCNGHHRAAMHSCKCHVFLHDTGAQRGQSNHGEMSHIRNIALITARQYQGLKQKQPERTNLWNNVRTARMIFRRNTKF